MSKFYLNRDDVILYVERSLPNDDLADFDLGAIADELIAAHPRIIGDHFFDKTFETRDQYLDSVFEHDAYWATVSRHDKVVQRVASCEADETPCPKEAVVEVRRDSGNGFTYVAELCVEHAQEVIDRG